MRSRPRLDANINKEATDGWEFVSASGFGDGESAFAALLRSDPSVAAMLKRKLGEGAKNKVHANLRTAYE